MTIGGGVVAGIIIVVSELETERQKDMTSDREGNAWW